MYKRHLIIGATGKTGTRVVKQLKQIGLQPKEASRSGQTLFDWQNTQTWQAALQGIEAVYLTYYPDLAMPQAPADIQRFCELAVQQGVKHVTLLSGRGEPAAEVCEQILQDSGLKWTIVRASWFNQNFSDGQFNPFIQHGKIALPVGGVGEPFIDIDDIAEVVTASLTDAKHNGKLYEVTGPELLTFANLADLFSHHLGRTVEFEQVSLAQFQQNMGHAGVDTGAIEMLTYLFTEVLDGRNEYICDGIEQALGRPAKSFEDFIKDNRHHFGISQNVA